MQRRSRLTASLRPSVSASEAGAAWGGAAAVLLGAGVRILGLGSQDLWGDEAFSVMTALGPIRNLLGSLATGEPHPPLYPLLLAAWLRALGHSELVARLPSAFAGIASIAVAMALARTFCHGDERSANRAALVAGLLVVVNPFQVWYAQESRMYVQVSLFAGLATLALLHLRHGRRGAIPLYALAVLGAAGSHYYGLFVPLAHGLALGATSRARPDVLRRWSVAAALAALAYLPWVVYARHVVTAYYGAQPGSVDLIGTAFRAWVRVAAGWSASWPFALAGAAVVTALALLGLAARPRSDEDGFLRLVLAFWLFTPYVAGFLVSLVRPIYAERYFAVTSLPVILLMARGIVQLLEGREGSGLKARSRDGRTEVPADTAVRGFSPSSLLPPFRAEPPARLQPAVLPWRFNARTWPIGAAALVLALVVAVGPLYNLAAGRYVKSTYNTHVRDVVALAGPDDAVILDGTSQMPLYSYYVLRPWPTYPLPRSLPLDPAATAQELSQVATRHTGAWIFLYATPDYDPGYFVPTWLTAHAYPAFDDWAVSGRLQYYRFAPDAALTSRATALTFGTSLTLDRYAYLPNDLVAGEAIPIDLRWTRMATELRHARVGLRLVDDAGVTWAQNDQTLGGDFPPAVGWLAGQPLDDHHGIIVPPGTPPGDYHLLLSAYSGDDLHPLPISGQGAPIGPSGVLLATVHVARPSQTIWAAGLAGYRPVGQMAGKGIELVGFAGSNQAKAGESGYLTIIWKAQADAPDAPTLRLELLGGDGRVAEQRDVALATASYPTRQWRAGDVLREQYRLPIADHLAAGTYRLAVVPLDSSGQALRATPLELGPLAIAAGALAQSVAPPQHPLAVTLGNAVELTGYDLASEQARPGATVNLALHWKDLAPLEADYTVFVHVLDSSEKIIAQRDQAPVGGGRPTSSWFAGDVILDPYSLTLPADLPAGRYPVEVGMYLPSTGARLPVSRDRKPDGDRVILATLDVGP